MFNRLKGQGKVELIYAVVMDKLDVDGGVIPIGIIKLDVVQSVEVYAAIV
ncbi:MAG: hypothetical protein E6583_09965 [Clostridium sp.]|nr:hypothetical protein [Clostridium sp.]